MLDQKVDPVINPSLLNGAYSYESYRELIDGLLEKNKSTGTNHSEDYVDYSKLNSHRMSRLDKTARINESLVEVIQAVNEELIWLVISEGWCGDAAQNVPVLQKMAEINPKISLKIILRDEHLEVIDQHLTNGGRSIPKLIILKADTLETLATWGPRPAPVQKLLMETRTENKLSPQELAIEIHKWYAKNDTQALQEEMLDLMKSLV